MLLPPDTPQGMADALGYLQYHLQELTERQHVSESNINSTLAALTAQLQQLTQLVANLSLPLPAVPNTPCKGTAWDHLDNLVEFTSSSVPTDPQSP